MQKRNVLSLFVLGLVAMSIFVQFAGVASAQGFFDDPFGTIATGLNSGEGFGDGFSRFLFGVVIALLVYAVTDKLPGMGKPELTWARGVISIIVAYFGTVFLAKGELLVLISSYSALGFTLGIILPFLILIFFSYDLWENDNIKNPLIKTWLIRSVWAVFGIFLLMRVVGLSGAGGAEENVLSWVKPGMWFLIIIVLIVIIFAKVIGRKIKVGKNQGTVEDTGDKVGKARAAVDQLSGFEDGDGI